MAQAWVAPGGAQARSRAASTAAAAGPAQPSPGSCGSGRGRRHSCPSPGPGPAVPCPGGSAESPAPAAAAECAASGPAARAEQKVSAQLPDSLVRSGGVRRGSHLGILLRGVLPRLPLSLHHQAGAEQQCHQQDGVPQLLQVLLWGQQSWAGGNPAPLPAPPLPLPPRQEPQLRCSPHLDLRVVLPRADDSLPLPIETSSGEATGGPQGEGHSLRGKRWHCWWPLRLPALPKRVGTTWPRWVEGRRKHWQLPAAPLPWSESLGKPKNSTNNLCGAGSCSLQLGLPTGLGSLGGQSHAPALSPAQTKMRSRSRTYVPGSPAALPGR